MFGLTLHSGTTATKCELVVLVVAVTFSQQISSLTRVHVGVSSAEEARRGQQSPAHYLTTYHLLGTVVPLCQCQRWWLLS